MDFGGVKNRGLFKLTRNACWRGETRRGLAAELLAVRHRWAEGGGPGSDLDWKVHTDAAARLKEVLSTAGGVKKVSKAAPLRSGPAERAQ